MCFLFQGLLHLSGPGRDSVRRAEVCLAAGQAGPSPLHISNNPVEAFLLRLISVGFFFTQQVWMYCRLYRTVPRFHTAEILEAAKAGE